MISERLAEALILFARTLATEYVAERALGELMAAVPEEVGVDGAGIMLHDEDGQLRFVAASDDTVRLIERFQVEAEEGPCVMASLTGERVFADDLAAGDERFPRFTALATAAGMRSVHSFPMRIGDQRIGALNLYRTTAGPLTDVAERAGEIFADMATAYLLSARRLDESTRLVTAVRAAFDRSAPIEQAKGYTAKALEITPSAAFEVMRTHARFHRLRVHDLATAILDGDLCPEVLRSAAVTESLQAVEVSEE